MSVSVSRASSFDARAHIRRAAFFHLLIDMLGIVVCPFFLLVPDLKGGEDYRLWFAKLAVGIVVPLLALWDLIRSVRYLHDPFNHPALQWREHGAPGTLIAELEQEMAATDQHFTAGKVVLTARWLVRATPFALIAVPYSQVAWAYKKVVTRRAFYGLVAVGKNYSLSLNTRNGKTQLIANISEEQVNTLLAQIVTRAPWAIVGYDGRAETMWKSRRAEFLQTVDARAAWVRQQAARKSGDATDFDLGAGASPMGPPQNPW